MMVTNPDLEGTTLSPLLPGNHTLIQLHTCEVSSGAHQQSLSKVEFCLGESTNYIILSPEEVLKLKREIEALPRRIQSQQCYDEGLRAMVSEGCTDAMKEFTMSKQEEQPHGDRVTQLEDLNHQLLTAQRRFLEHIAAVLRREYVDSHSLRNDVLINSEVLEHESTNSQERPVTGYDDSRTSKLDEQACTEMDPTHKANNFPEGPHEMSDENEGDSNYGEFLDKNEPAGVESFQSQSQLINSDYTTIQDGESHMRTRYSPTEDSERPLGFNKDISPRFDGQPSDDEDLSFTSTSGDGMSVGMSEDSVFKGDAFANDQSDEEEENSSVTSAGLVSESGTEDADSNDGGLLSKLTETSDFQMLSRDTLSCKVKSVLEKVQDLKGQIQLNENHSHKARQIRVNDIQGLEGTLEEVMKFFDLVRLGIEPFDTEIVEKKSQNAQINPANPILMTQISTKDACNPERAHDKVGNESKWGDIIAGLTTGAAAAKTLQGFVNRFCADKLNQTCANGCKEELENKNYIKTELDNLVELLDELIKRALLRLAPSPTTPSV